MDILSLINKKTGEVSLSNKNISCLKAMTILSVFLVSVSVFVPNPSTAQTTAQTEDATRRFNERNFTPQQKEFIQGVIIVKGHYDEDKDLKDQDPNYSLDLDPKNRDVVEVRYKGIPIGKIRVPTSTQPGASSLISRQQMNSLNSARDRAAQRRNAPGLTQPSGKVRVYNNQEALNRDVGAAMAAITEGQNRRALIYRAAYAKIEAETGKKLTNSEKSDISSAIYQELRKTDPSTHIRFSGVVVPINQDPTNTRRRPSISVDAQTSTSEASSKSENMPGDSKYTKVIEDAIAHLKRNGTIRNGDEIRPYQYQGESTIKLMINDEFYVEIDPDRRKILGGGPIGTRPDGSRYFVPYRQQQASAAQPKTPLKSPPPKTVDPNVALRELTRAPAQQVASTNGKRKSQTVTLTGNTDTTGRFSHLDSKKVIEDFKEKFSKRTHKGQQDYLRELSYAKATAECNFEYSPIRIAMRATNSGASGATGEMAVFYRGYTLPPPFFSENVESFQAQASDNSRHCRIGLNAFRNFHELEGDTIDTAVAKSLQICRQVHPTKRNFLAQRARSSCEMGVKRAVNGLSKLSFIRNVDEFENSLKKFIVNSEKVKNEHACLDVFRTDLVNRRARTSVQLTESFKCIENLFHGKSSKEQRVALDNFPKLEDLKNEGSVASSTSEQRAHLARGGRQ